MTDRNSKEIEQRSFSDLNKPFLGLMVFAFVCIHIIELPLWITLVPIILFSTGFPLLIERRLIKELAAFKPVGISLSVLSAGLLYFAFSFAVARIAELSIENTLSEDGSLPLFFSWMLTIKTHISELPFIVTIICGSLFLAVSEEIFWRGYVLTRFMLSFNHPVSAIGSSILFGGFYLLLSGPIAAIAAFIAGIVFATLTLGFRSIVPAAVAHCLLWVIFMVRPII